MMGTGTTTATNPFWRIVVTDSFGYTVWDSYGSHVDRVSWQPTIVYSNYGPPAEPPSEFKSLYQRRLERSLEAIAERVRDRVRFPRRVVTRPRQTALFARRTCSMASRWMVLQ